MKKKPLNPKVLVTGVSYDTAGCLCVFQTNLNGGTAKLEAKYNGMDFSPVKDLSEGFEQIKLVNGTYRVILTGSATCANDQYS